MKRAGRRLPLEVAERDDVGDDKSRAGPVGTSQAAPLLPASPSQVPSANAHLEYASSVPVYTSITSRG
jgi:hypothetical protein